MICRYKFLYYFLLTVPFFNIFNLHFGNDVVQAYVFCFFALTLLFFPQQRIQTRWAFPIALILGLSFCLLLTELHSYIIFGQSNISAIRFFGLFIPVLAFYVLFYDPTVFCEKYWYRLLRYYIVVFSLSIVVDYFILHTALDVSLQPMYDEEALSYHDRPFGITGQPSVNSVLLVFFYTLLLSQRSFIKSKLLFLLMIVGVFLQGSGSGFIAFMCLVLPMLVRSSWYFVVSVASFCLLMVSWQSKILNKVSLQYVHDIVGVFIKQIDDWVMLVGMSTSSPAAIFLFGGLPSGIDFGPLYLVSNVGIIFLLLFITVIITTMVLTKCRYEKLALIILMIGNLHYPVMFYLIMAFVLPLILQKNMFSVQSYTKIGVK